MSSPTPPGTPKAGSRWASRMGAAVRRSSTLLSIARPATPQTDRDSDSTSLRKSISREALPASVPKLNTTPPPAPPLVMVPTPIAESPARETEATQRDAVGPSPLVQSASVDANKAAEAPAPAQDPIATSPVGYVPPPLIDSSAGNPGAFTDILETIPQPDVVRDPYAASNTGPPPAPPAEEPAPVEEPPAAPPVEEPVPVAIEEPAPTVEYIPPPVLDSSAGNPGAFTDEPEELPQPTAARDPYAERAPSPAPAAAEESVIEAKEEPAHEPTLDAPTMEHSASYFDDKAMAESMLDYDPMEAAPPVEFARAVEASAPIVRPDTPEPEPAPAPVAMPVAEPAPVEHVEQAPQPEQETSHPHGEAESYYGAAPPMPVAETSAPPAADHIEEPATNGNADREAPPTFRSAVMPSYDLPEYMSPDIWGNAEHTQKPHNVWETAPKMPEHEPAPAPEESEEHSGYTTTLPIVVPIPVRAEPSAGNGHGNGSVDSTSSGFKYPMPNPHPGADDEDPFADPVVPVSNSNVEDVHYPEVSAPHPQLVAEIHDDTQGIVTMPLPTFTDVVSQPIPRIASHSSLGDSHTRMPEVDERMPLLSGPHSSNKKHRAYGPTQTNHASISPLASSSWNPHGVAHQPRLHELGWLEYHLPDGAVYYVHPTHRTTTDLDLRSQRVLDAVEHWLEDAQDEPRDVGVEAWLRAGPARTGKKGWGSGKKGEEGVAIERFWVDHHARTVVKDTGEDRRVLGYTRGHIRGNGGRGKGKRAAVGVPEQQEDQLDLEFRFWSFMEAHPAHNALPHKAKAEAMDVLTWAWTDRLLPSARPIPAPFSQDECQELMTLLRSFRNEDHHDDHGIQTRVVSRILLRVALWRQTYFRPNKPLPKDVGSGFNELPVYRRPFRRVFFDFILSFLCLGIPYLFLERARLSSRTDQESGFFRSNPLVVIGACTCLVAALILSASVTFLALPGLDNIARTSGMIAVVFAAFSMIATAVSILRHKADLERPLSRAGIEGLIVISRRTVALSLPTVFLAYALIGFLTGVVIYTFRSVPADPHSPRKTFEEYTRWIIVGVVGALAGIVTISLIVLRR